MVAPMGLTVAHNPLAWLAEHPWAYPALEVAHILGIALLVGNLVAFELRVWGAAAALPIEPLARLSLGLALGGFGLVAATVALRAGDLAAADAHLRDAEQTLAATPEPPADLLAERVALRAYQAMALGDLGRGPALVERALAVLPETSPLRATALVVAGEVAFDHGVGVHHPCHHLFVGVDVRRRDILGRADDQADLEVAEMQVALDGLDQQSHNAPIQEVHHQGECEDGDRVPCLPWAWPGPIVGARRCRGGRQIIHG